MKNFMIRRSALVEGSFYIDFDGEYEISKIAKITQIPANTLDHIYAEHYADYDSEHHVYYFAEYGNIADVVKVLDGLLKPGQVNRTVELTEEEIEYIRKALINEDSNVIFTKNSVRESIFRKLND